MFYKIKSIDRFMAKMSVIDRLYIGSRSIYYIICRSVSSPRIKNNKTYLKYTGYLFGVSKNMIVN